MTVFSLSHASAAQVQVIHPVEALPGHPKFPQGYARADGGAFQSKSVLADILNIIERALGGTIGADQPLMEVCSGPEMGCRMAASLA